VIASGVLFVAFGSVAQLGATLPYRSNWHQAFILETILNFILMLVILGSGLDRRAHIGFAGIAIGLTVGLEAACMGPIIGASMKRIMFVCRKNSRRSRMAEGFAKALGKDKVAITSSGLEASQVDPIVMQVMSEVGIDVSQQVSNPLGDFQPEDYDLVIFLCGCGVNLPQAWVLREVLKTGNSTIQKANPLICFDECGTR
jgi:arsenate reductase (thioredoxin)